MMNLNRFLLGVIISSALALIVLAAIAAEALPALIAGVIVLGLISIGLATIGVNLFSRLTDAQHKMRSLQYDHAERMAARGLIPTGRGYADYRPLVQPSPVPEVRQIPSPEKSIQFVHSDPQVLAVNLLLFTIQLGRRDKNLIASAPECAAAGIIGYSARKRDYAVRYLEEKYGVVTASGNGGGTYVPEEIGTVGKLYDMLTLNSAIALIPEGKK